MIVYEDGACTAELQESGAVLGQVRIRPRRDASTLSDLPSGESTHLFFVASYAATAVFEGLGAQGTNILVREGDALELVVVPRMQGDGVDMFWDAERADPAELQTVAGRLKDKLFYVGTDAGPTEPQGPQDADRPEPEREPKESGVAPEDNYKLRQLQRSP